VFEELPFAGGMLRYGIPEYRLSRPVIQAEIDDIAALGVEIKTNCRVGRDIEYSKLKADYDILVLATGAHKSWTLDVEGEDLAGVWGAVEFLREVNLGSQAKVGNRVAVIGGGNTAIDAARTAIRMGARDVTILYRREKKDMPAWANEIAAAEEEGVKIECLVAPVKFTGKSGKLTGVVCQRMRLGEFDRSGRRKAVPVEGDQFTMAFDCVIPAISQSSDTSFIPESAGIQVTNNGTFKIQPRAKTCTAASGVFAAGDAVLGPATVVEAVAMGHQAADEVDSAIRAANNEQPYKAPAEEQITIPFEVDEEPLPTPRGKMPELKPSERILSFKEVELGYTAEIAWAEACRCQRCDGCDHQE
jgi:NADPH-dependent glutamate synthase beta subunit-like oxidoreductase